MSSTILLPARAQLCNRSCSNKHTLWPAATLYTHSRLAHVGSWLGQLGTRHGDDEAFRREERMGRVGFDTFSPWMEGHPSRCLTLRGRSLYLQGDPANIGKGWSRPARCTRGAEDRFGIPNPRKSGSVIGADRQRFVPSCVLLNACHKAERKVGV